MPVVTRSVGRVLDELRDHVHEQLLVVVAFDGVLTRYQIDPAAVWLDAARKTLLRQVADAPAVTLAVISGRRVSDLQARAPIGDDVFYIGLHGLELVGPAFVRVQRAAIERCRDGMRALENSLAPVIATMPGVRLENKDGAIALHTRGADSGDAIWSRLLLLSRAADLASAGLVRVLRGHDVLELLPNELQPRATAVVAIRDVVEQRGRRSTFVLYVGADTIDDDALEAVSDTGMSVVVGRRTVRAPYHLSTREEVDHLISAVSREWRNAPHHAWIM